jgi:AraC-like DNA-binding protein
VAAPLDSVRPGLSFQRNLRVVAPGLVGLAQRITSEGTSEHAVVTGRFWIFSTLQCDRGLNEVYDGHRWIPMRPTWTFLIPPRSLFRLRLTDLEARCAGFAGDQALPARYAVPVVAPIADGTAPPNGLDEMHRLLTAATPCDIDAHAPPLARRARRALHDVLDSPHPVREVADRLGVAPATISRRLQSAYGISSKRYVHGARIFDAVLLLLAGRPVADSALEAGFADLSRFYRQFQRVTHNTPGDYSALRDQKAPRRPLRAGP